MIATHAMVALVCGMDHTGRVLVVDDEAGNRELLRLFFEKRGWQVDEAVDGEAAAHAWSAAVDVVLLDVTMPKRDGLEVLRTWRQSGVTTPVIMLTAVGHADTAVAALQAGAQDYVTKPFSLMQLEERMQRALVAAVEANVVEVEVIDRDDDHDSSAIMLPESSTPTDTTPRPQGWLPWRNIGAGAILGGRYRLDALLGQGSCGAVWRARHTDLDLDVAVKVLHKDGPTIGPDRLHAFRTEGMLAARVHHQNVLRVQDFGAHGSHLYLVTELLRGVCLAEHIDKLTFVQATGLVSDVLDALACLHHHDIVHRDVKASNIFLHRRGIDKVEAKLIDFGAATTVAEAGLSVVGTISHMAPECILRQAGKPADVFAAGVMWYHLITRTLPFGADHKMAVAPSGLAPLPAFVDGVMGQLLHPIANERPTAAGAASLLRGHIRARR
jgi:CheY-like chemotaxis protein